MKKLNTDVLIIGAGPAGLALSLYLKRANIPFLIFEKYIPGGKLVNIKSISNYLGFKYISGPDLALSFIDQIKENNIEIIEDEIVSIEEGFISKSNNYEINSKLVVFASGTTVNQVNIKNYYKFLNRGISKCASCDGHLYKDKNIMVIGNNNHANEEYDYLKRLTNNIIKINDEKEIISFEGNEKLSKVITSKKEYEIDGCFIYLNESFDERFSNLKIELKNGHILVNENYETSHKNIYAIGDIINKKIYQIVGAIDDASKLSVELVKRLK